MRTFFYCAEGFKTGLTVTAILFNEDSESVEITAEELGYGVYKFLLSLGNSKHALVVIEDSIPKFFTTLGRY